MAANNSEQVNVGDIKVRFEGEKRPRYDLSALLKLKYKKKGRNNQKSRATRSSFQGKVEQTNKTVIHQLQCEPESVQMGFDDYNSADKFIFEPHISEHVSGDIETFEVIFIQQYK